MAAGGIYYSGAEDNRDILETLSDMLRDYDMLQMQVLSLNSYIEDFKGLDDSILKETTYTYILEMLEMRSTMRGRRISNIESQLDHILVQLNYSDATVLTNLKTFLNYKVEQVDSTKTKTLITSIIEGMKL